MDLMAIVKEPSIKDYWKTVPIFHYALIASKNLTERFRDIRRYLYLYLAKIHPITDMINKHCDEVYDLMRDEAIIKFPGQSAFKQYVPKKPIKRGIKVWVMADSENGYFTGP